MDINEIEKYILEKFNDVHTLDSWGEKRFLLNSGRQLKRGTYFPTLTEKDGDNDKAYYLDCDGIFRLNMGVSKDICLSLFNTKANGLEPYHSLPVLVVYRTAAPSSERHCFGPFAALELHPTPEQIKAPSSARC